MTRYQVVISGLAATFAPLRVKAALANLLNTSAEHVDSLIANAPSVVSTEVDLETATRLQGGIARRGGIALIRACPGDGEHRPSDATLGQDSGKPPSASTTPSGDFDDTPEDDGLLGHPLTRRVTQPMEPLSSLELLLEPEDLAEPDPPSSRGASGPRRPTVPSAPAAVLKKPRRNKKG